jgi:hypothetical protein
MKRSWILLALAMTAAPLLAVAAAIDDAKVAAEGIRKLPGKRITLYTDVAGPEIDQLPGIFDLAFPQWCSFFGVKPDDVADWHVTGCLIKDKNRFVAAGLLPDDLPPFKHGYSRGAMLWLNEQPTDFYRRELLLHEGTHSFMNNVLHGMGPPWFAEGMAEYLGTHRWHDGRLTLGYMPRNRDEARFWRRVGIIQDAVAERRAMKLASVIDYPNRAFLETEPYAWCWAAVTLLDRHPRYHERLRQLIGLVRQPDFNRRFYRLFDRDWQQLCEEWQLMVVGMEYGYDVARSAVDFTPGKPLPPGGAKVTVAADRGWQNSGLRLEAGVKYRLTASGRYQVAVGQVGNLPRQIDNLPHGSDSDRQRADKQAKPWWCEPGGVSIRYYKGRPLGILLAAVRPDNPPPGSTSALLHPTVIGLGSELRPTETGTLFLKINDSAGELDDNSGELKVEVRNE